MKNYKNHYKRNRYRSNGDRNFKRNERNGGLKLLHNDFSNGLEFKRKNPGRNNQNASKLIEKYKDLAREALSNGDKILSENYLQHADHYTRISEEQFNFKSLEKNKNLELKDKSKSEEKIDIENQENL
tara:strand:- start:15 stop:398 length:384 start_codon:yes stop_codon:yes gene_type:complete